MEIYLVRHTTPCIEKGICYGQSDLDLDNDYYKEFENITQQIPQNKLYNVISSPLKRCSLLAYHLSSFPEFDNRLKELHFGDWELKAWHNIAEEELNPWMQDFVNVSPPNGESYLELASRVSAFFEDLKQIQTAKDIIIVTHAGVIRAYLSKFLGIELEQSFKIKMDYGAVFQLKKENGTLNLVTPLNLKG
ncbi:alpha-ribazole phosphatase [Snuella sedimenti]|uniref:Alpha-ribazole phosphatase n=1 Tax=Snuella sedimenti TaxID=2798802 RepID=A0A8J7J2N4_9FLAO|nr:alpha-ribazole phosphatase [Snuella sedimenti]MBJ6367103.1 alpha-ribazole phosphatase [Snuella sedimenti]